MALLHIPTFDKETVQEVREALGKNSGKIKDKLLIDLRGVSSGDPELAYATARLFTSGDLGSSSGAPRICRASAPRTSRSGRARR